VRALSRPARPPQSLILDTGLGAVFHTVLVFSVFLLFAGHNAPGGGFIGGLVAGAAFVLHYVAGGAGQVRRVAPVASHVLMGAGLTLAALVGVGSLFAGGQLLESGVLSLELPVLGKVKTTSALPFDIGVYLIVVGLVLAVLGALGGEADRPAGEDEGDQAGPGDREVAG
jgi:multicomponent Na+:H+ antiporter subunit A